MENIYSTLRKIKERISPSKPKKDAVPAETTRTKRKASSSDNPFEEKGDHGERLGSKRMTIDKKSRALENVDRKVSVSPFIKNQNLMLSKVPQMDKLDSVRSESIRQQNNTLAKSLDERVSERPHADRVELQSKVSRADIAPAGGDEEREGEEDFDDEDEEKEDEDKVPLEVLEEMNKLEECFPRLSKNYRLMEKIGEGTFSTVYKAEALNGSIKLKSDLWKSPPLRNGKPSKKTGSKKNPIVALKQIYVTSSPSRIYNELNLLYMLSGSVHVAPLLDVLRFQDQVLAILPYYSHSDFRDFYRDLPVKGIKKYMWELFHALSFIHEKDVIHRDLKPTNFLYDPFKGKGLLVDFGLAEKAESTNNYKNINVCPCINKDRSSATKVYNKRMNFKAAYPKQDQRPPRRANRAGTRGFRAPEVLFKCTNQTTKLDIWSAGIIGLSFLTRKFPLFNSPDDTDALLELSLIFGLEKLQQSANIHGCGLEINLSEDITNTGNLIKVVADFLRYESENKGVPDDSVVHDTLSILNEKGDGIVKPTPSQASEDASFDELMDNYLDHKHLFQLLYGCFHMDPKKRLSANEILKLPFFSELVHNSDDEIVL
ncbi:Piso0_004499 [Millerozyma farinosa CBS 7064]|uniref:non-specific serine/threonine protein kinase n=1 Tax=Pichia sorbitophila (strain ATCC MYA-4447 / BCRC 22081 / CBS 7064 / NBRC 10061 / NRRL Y-12695) TaxID=559304 RepID=G8Y5M2_PICSO|nr:Piso0_004499 [Millerozyma farinosa CBS 7064]CCE84933.1 Piso0_004499 [Millerozyma farinosa CBS 7064]